MCALHWSAIASACVLTGIVSASASRQAQCQRTSKTSRRHVAKGTNDPSTSSTNENHSVSDTDDTESSDQEASQSAAGKGSKLQQAKRND